MNSELIISFKDFLMGLPTGLRFKILIDNSELTTGTIDKAHETLKFSFKTLDNKTLNAYLGESYTPIKTVPMKASYQINLLLLNPAGAIEKSIGIATMNIGKRLTIVAVSPWVKVPLSGGGSVNDSFLNVEYNVKRRDNHIETVNVAIFDIPKKIITTALKYRGSTAWAYTTQKTSARHSTNGAVTFPNGSNKCNLFVHDILIESGISVAWIEHGKSTYIPFYKRLSPPTAREWADASQLTASWSSNNEPKAGDIGAYSKDYTDASGHVGFVIAKGVCISAGEEKVEVNDVGFRHYNRTAGPHDTDFTIFRRYKNLKVK